MTQSKFDGKHSGITELVITAFYKVHRIMGYGFNEKVYENSLAIELGNAGLQVAKQKEINVYYDGQIVGTYFADIIVNGVVMLELKAVKQLLDEHEAQLLNYLKATQIEVGLLLNFGPTPSVRGYVLDNHRKGSMDWTEEIECWLDADFTDYTAK